MKEGSKRFCAVCGKDYSEGSICNGDFMAIGTNHPEDKGYDASNYYRNITNVSLKYLNLGRMALKDRVNKIRVDIVNKEFPDVSEHYKERILYADDPRAVRIYLDALVEALEEERGEND